MVYAACSIGVDIELTVTKTEQMLTGPGRLLRPVEPARIPSDRNCIATTRAFLLQKSEIEEAPRVHRAI